MLLLAELADVLIFIPQPIDSSFPLPVLFNTNPGLLCCTWTPDRKTQTDCLNRVHNMDIIIIMIFFLLYHIFVHTNIEVPKVNKENPKQKLYTWPFIY